MIILRQKFNLKLYNNMSKLDDYYVNEKYNLKLNNNISKLVDNILCQRSVI